MLEQKVYHFDLYCRCMMCLIYFRFVENSGPPTLAEKTDFSKAIYLVGSDILGKIVQTLSTVCEKALHQISPDEMEILVDEIEPEIFWELDALVRKNISTETKEKVVVNSSGKKGKRPTEDVSSITKAKKAKH